MNFKDGGYYKNEISKTWPEHFTGVHQRAMLTADYYSMRMQQFRDNGDLQNGKTVCLLLFSHGMILLQMGNMVDEVARNQSDSHSPIAMPSPENFKTISKEQKKALVDRVKHIDWVF